MRDSKKNTFAILHQRLRKRSIRYGEKLLPESPLFREQFDTTGLFESRHPHKTDKKVLGELLRRSLQKAGVMETTKMIEGQAHGKHRNSIQRTHGFRKFVNTTFINARLNDTIRNMLLGHSTDLDDVYYKPKPDDLLQEYLKAVDALTINEEHRLRRKVRVLTIKADRLDLLAQQMDKLNKKLGLEPLED
jgi:hypothetical protein